MAQQQTKNIVARLIAKVQGILTQMNSNTTAIKGKIDTSTFNTEQTRVNVALNSKANIDLSNVNVGSTHGRKLLYTDALGRVIYVDYPTQVDISGKADLSYVNTELGKKANAGVSYTKAESDGKYLTSHQDISGKANKTLDNVDNADFAAKLQSAGVNTGIFNEFKGVLASAPTGTHNDLDWYINDTDNKLYLWHSNQWNNIGGGATATLDKEAILNLLGLQDAQLNILKTTKEFTQAEKTKLASALTAHQDISGKASTTLDNVLKATVLAKLGITQAQLDKTLILAGKTLTQSTLTFDDNTTKTVFIME